MHSEDTKLSKSLGKILADENPKTAANKGEAIASSLNVPSEAQEALHTLIERRAIKDEEEQQQVEPDKLTDHYRSLIVSGFSETAAVLLAEDRPTLLSLSSSDFPIFASSEVVIGKWVEAQAGQEEPKTTKELQAELITIALSKPEEAIQCALASWVCRAMDPKKLRKLVPLVATDFFSDSRLRLLDLVMLRDKDGDFTIRWLREKPDLADQTSARILFNPRLMQHALGAAPRWFSHPSAEPLIHIFMDWVKGLPTSTQKARAELSGRLLTLAGALVPIANKSEPATKLLKDLQTLGLKVWKSAADTEDFSHTWAFVQSGSSLGGDEKPELNADQAKQLSLALLRARKGKDPVVELESACVNLGASRFGEIGEVVTYDATIHNDLDGGLLPEDPVTIVRPGLKFPNGATVKADVRLIPES